ncbi:MAG: nSTAND1 domain-containing NTPase, partial [Anaerolineales bacterium]
MTTASEPAVAPVPEPADPYPSLDALRTAHRDLVGANRDAEEALSDIAAIEVFVQRAQITGALLDSERDRQAAQSLLNYWSTRLYRAGHEPPDAILADFDSALAPELPDAACPYCGLDSFREDNQHFYFGRKHLGDQLLQHLRHDNLLAVLGASGSGKSSLVRAGLIPALKEGALPESDRWRYYEPMVPGSNPLLNLARILKPPKADESYVSQ